MKTILVAGAGKSSTALIRYLLSKAEENDWQVAVLDGSSEAIAHKTQNHPRSKAVVADLTDDATRDALVSGAAIVVSLMPPTLHHLLAQSCLRHGRHLITASYIAPEIAEMDAEVREAGLLFLCEMGLDPGIDHMSAHRMLHAIQARGGAVTSFKSYCGGLIAPESDTNPWRYKFSWNPANIVAAGKSGAHYLEHGQEAHVPYEKMFGPRELVEVPGCEPLAYYPNRDSLSYIKGYQLEGARDFLRATLRYPEFMTGWNAVVDLGLADDADAIPEDCETVADWYDWKTGGDAGGFADMQKLLGNQQGASVSKVMAQFDALGFFDEIPLPAGAKTSADVMLAQMLDRWTMEPHDKDLVVMKHEVDFTLDRRPYREDASLVLTGDDRDLSAMAKTVGMPMAIAAEMILKGAIADLPTGVRIPDMPEIFEPVLDALAKQGISFVETTTEQTA